MRMRWLPAHLVAAFLGALLLATGCGEPNPPSPQTTTAISSASTRPTSLWAATELSYPDDPVASTYKDIGERTFPHRDIRLSLVRPELLDASGRYALLTDRRSQRLHAVDLRSGRTRVLLSSPLTLREAPSRIWVRARAALRKTFGARFTPTLIFSARISGRQVVWQEALCITTGGFDMDAWALYAARLTPQMQLGPAKLLALVQPPFVPAGRPEVNWPRVNLTLEYSLQQKRLLLIRGVGRGEVAEVVDLTSDRREVLLDPPRSLSAVEGALAGERAVVCCLTGEDTARLLTYDLADDGLPCGVADLPQSNLQFTDLRGFALAPDGRLAWAKWYTPGGGTDDAEAVFLLSPDGTIECLAPIGGEPVFFGSTVLWVGLTGSRFWLGGADLDARERFTVTAADHVKSWSVAGDGHVAVVLVESGDRASSTLRVFDVR
jgi:hypothetical protein